MLVCVTVALALSVPSTAYAWAGHGHQWAAAQSIGLFTEGLPEPTAISRDRQWPAYPELLDPSYGWDPASDYDSGESDEKTWYMANWEFLRQAAVGADDACWAAWGLNHFWRVADGLHDCPYGYDADNSWETTSVLWARALVAWQAGDLGWAYTQLGYCMHHIQDACVPSHANDDTHAEDELEDNFLGGTNTQSFYAWDGSARPPGPEIPWPTLITRDNGLLFNDILNAGCWDSAGCDYPVNDDVWDFPMLTNPALPFNMQKYFYLLYWADQIGNYFASEDEDGASNAHDPTGWMGGYAGFPTALHDEDGNLVSIHSWTGVDDNDSCDCNDDGDMATIGDWTYGAAFKASPTIIELFRNTVDSVPPVTTAEVERVDGESVVQWNNSSVWVRLLSAEDAGNPGFRVSGVWKVWGLCDGNPPGDYDAPAWLISEDGKHKVECMSTDKIGNVERDQDIHVWVDQTPPEITFPDLRPNYLTSEDFTATWVATDATSGVASETAYLDGQLVAKDQVFDLALMAGLHRLEVYADDLATNMAYAIYDFEVFIDASTWAQPVYLNKKTKGTGMYCGVELPAPYNVALVKLNTTILAVKGTLDLGASDPIVGETATLRGELLTGVGDHDLDAIRDRMIRFNKERFAAALGGQVGGIPAVVQGGLSPNGMPRFLGVVTVPVFGPGT